MKILERFNPQDILVLPSGFLAKYAGSNQYADIEDFQNSLYAWVKKECDRGRTFDYLDDAIRAFVSVTESHQEDFPYEVLEETTIELQDRDVILEQGDRFRIVKATELDEKKKVRVGKVKKSEDDEWMVPVYVDGKFNDDLTYYAGEGASAKEDAEGTRDQMIKDFEDSKEYELTEEAGRSRFIKEGYSIPILPFGAVELASGANKTLGNVFSTWSDGRMICEFWEIQEAGAARIRLVIGSGTIPNYSLGTIKAFDHDQTGRHLFVAKLVDSCVLNDLPSKASRYGRSLHAYVYK